MPNPAPPTNKHSTVLKRIYFGVSIILGLLLVTGAITLVYLKFKPKPNQLNSISPVSSPLNSIKIAAIGPLSGNRTLYGLAHQRFLSLIAQQINEQGGINGSPIEILWGDGQCNSIVTEKITASLLTQQINFFISGFCDEEVLASVPLIQEKKITAFSPAATANKISKFGQYHFQLSPNNQQLAKAALSFMTQQKPITTLATISEGTSSAELTQQISQLFTNSGGHISHQLSYQPGQTDFESLNQNLLADPPELIFLDVVHDIPTAHTLLKNFRDTNIDIPILSNNLIINRRQLRYRQQILQNHYVIEQELPENTEFTTLLDRYKQTYQQEPPYPATFANLYETILLIKYGIESARGQIDSVDNVLYELNSWQGLYPQLKLSSTGESNLPLRVYQINNHNLQKM